MTKLEELKAALEAATPGEWVDKSEYAPNMATVGTGEKGWLGLAQMFGDTQDEANSNATFIVEKLEYLNSLCSDYNEEYWATPAYRETHALLEKLK